MSTVTRTPQSGHDLLDALPSVSLDALAVHAARMTRVDRKYLVPRRTVDLVLAACADDAVALEIDGERAFAYASTYLDTAQLRCFLDGGRSRRRRFKVRTRSYLDSGEHYLEVKTAGPRRTTVKTRLRLEESFRGVPTASQVDFVARTLAGHGITDVDVPALAPTLQVTYTRSTLAFLAEGHRTTIDTDLTWATPQGTALTVPALAVIETKAGSTPTAVDRALWRLGHRPARMSKYGTGLAATHPHLPHLKWHHTLNHPLLRPPTLAHAS